VNFYKSCGNLKTLVHNNHVYDDQLASKLFVNIICNYYTIYINYKYHTHSITFAERLLNCVAWWCWKLQQWALQKKFR